MGCEASPWTVSVRRRARRRLAGRPHRLEKRHERIDLGGAQVLAVGGHVATALQDLPDELIAREARGDPVESRAALASLAAETVTVPALLVLDHERALQLERRAALHIGHRR